MTEVKQQIVLSKPLEAPKKRGRGRERIFSEEEAEQRQRDRALRWYYQKKYGEQWEMMWKLKDLRNQISNNK